MARRISKPTPRATASTTKTKDIIVESSHNHKFKQSFQACWQFLCSSRFRLIAGIVLLFVALLLLISYISFFFTGANDFSIIEQAADRRAMRLGIRNALGLPGALISDWLINDTFGIVSILLIAALATYAVWLLHEFPLRGWRVFAIAAFGLLWGSVTLGFAQQITGFDTFFRWGGAHGQAVSAWATSYIQPLGLLLVLLVTLVIFLIVIDRHFIEHCQRFGKWCKGLFHKKETASEEDLQPVQPEEDTPIEITTDDNKSEEEGFVIDLTPNNEDTPSAEERTEYNEIRITIENTIPEPESVEEDSPSSADTTQSEPDAPLDIEEPQDVELSEQDPDFLLRKLGPYDPRKDLENDIMLSLSATGIRIIAPMPGKGTIGIEVPNEKPQTVSMHSVIASKRFQDEQKMRLPIAIGRTITNEVFLFDLAKTPHLLVAGATGQGKSVAINAILTSLLYKKHPAELKLVLVDPKMVEFSPYKELYRHYLAAMPDVEEQDIIITDCEKVINTLNSLVIEMENRYKLLMDAGVRNLEDYNDKFVKRRLNPEKLVADSLHHRYLPYIVIVIDEYGDFIMQAGKQVETPIARITQKARAVGMHMILATQRPSVNIVTGVIKANIPTRIALRTQSVIDSRTVLDAKGAEQLIGRGDMLYAGNGNITRIQCAFVDTPEVDAIVEYIEEQQHYFEPYQLPEYIPEGQEDAVTPGSVDMKRLDPMFADVARYVVAKQEGSTSRLQRAFEIGYNRAGKLSDQLEAAGIVGPNKGPKGRDVMIQDMDMLEQKLQELGAV